MKSIVAEPSPWICGRLPSSAQSSQRMNTSVYAPVMSIRGVNALSHYTDWGIGHVHAGTLGWNAFITFGALYYLVPVLWKREGLYSKKLASWHFWISTLGIVFYITSMWVAGIMQGLMWRAYDALGFLQYSFAESVSAVHPYYVIRTLGGVLFLTGMLIMVYNLIQTVRSPVTERRAALAMAGT